MAAQNKSKRMSTKRTRSKNKSAWYIQKKKRVEPLEKKISSMNKKKKRKLVIQQSSSRTVIWEKKSRNSLGQSSEARR